MKRNISVLLLLTLLLTLLVLPVQAQTAYVTDDAGLLTEQQRSELESLCASVSQRQSSAVYIMTVEDYWDYGTGDVFEVTYGLYHGYGLGKGADRNGVILLLSMAERDFALFVYGDQAEYGLNSHAQLLLEEAFLPYFAENDWYGGFRTYVEDCGRYLARGDAGDPVKASPVLPIVVAVALSFLAALIVCSILKAGMKNVFTGGEAAAYVSVPLNLTQRHDQFTHTTQTRRKIESNSGSRSGGGGSGRSGKF